MKRRAIVQAVTASIVMPAQSLVNVFAQAAYPNKPITFVCPYYG